MNGYICFFEQKRIEVHAENLLQAKEEALKQFKPCKSKRHLVSVHLAECNGEQVTSVITN